MRSSRLVLILLCLFLSDKSRGRRTPTGSELETLIHEYNDAIQDIEKKYDVPFKSAKTESEKSKIRQAAETDAENLRLKQVPKILAATQQPLPPAAKIQGLMWLEYNSYPDKPQELKTYDYALGQLTESVYPQVEEADVNFLVDQMLTNPSVWAERFLRKTVAEGKSDTLKGLASFQLARRLKIFADRLAASGDAKALALRTEAMQLFRTVQAKYPTVGRVADKKSLGLIVPGEIYELENLSVGKVAPEIEAQDILGKPFRLSELRGRVVLIQFQGDWCRYCQDQKKEISDLLKKHVGKPISFVHINSDADKQAVVKKLEAGEFSGPVLWDEGSTNGALSTRWNVSAWPMTYAIDAAGVIRAKRIMHGKLEETIRKLLAELPNAKKTKTNKAK